MKYVVKDKNATGQEKERKMWEEICLNITYKGTAIASFQLETSRFLQEVQIFTTSRT